MSAVRQKRQSCEACRKGTGCSRCVKLGLTCKFHDKGIPGRPRKWSLVETRNSQHHRHHIQQAYGRDGQDAALETDRSSDHQSDGRISYQQDTDLQQNSAQTPSMPAFAEASLGGTSASTNLWPAAQQEWTLREADELSIGYDEFGGLPSLLDFNTSEQLGSLPLDPFQACLLNYADGTASAERSPNASATRDAPPPPQQQQEVCDCARRVFEVIRLLKSGPVSHNTVRTLRLGADLVEKLLKCVTCYDTSSPPRYTLQNVLLLGRLSLEVTNGYQKYVRWLKDYCSGLSERGMDDTVYLMSGVDASSALGFKISSDKFYSLVVDGLKSDAERLSVLGRQFEVRQHNRHLVGHEACPDPEGRCLKEEKDHTADPDLLDVCPQSLSARVLTPCYQIVDEVRSKVKQFKDAVT
ncbi:unnamed protein product [Clonostachys chloroleuca]|uniref:Zn(2)-C6 fungal-type domain-containing protein n=1 Tax=Clonostachys chloroleuca TaxID=1926264 RepID=A0AA35Q1T8_9HYPO|nr:unnamed protein product [Clonostachys chloroleuca]